MIVDINFGTHRPGWWTWSSPYVDYHRETVVPAGYIAFQFSIHPAPGTAHVKAQELTPEVNNAG